MKTRTILLPALLLAAVVTPARADVMLYAHRADAVHVNVYRPMAGQANHETSDPEVSMFFGKLDVLIDPNEEGYPEEGGCIDIFHDNVIDAGCGTLTFEADGIMDTTRIRGTIETTAYQYYSETVEFIEIGPSQIVVDLTVKGTGEIELSPFSNYAVGVCGLPPDTRGVFVDARPELQRDAAMSGTLESLAAGAVDVTKLPALLVQASNVATGACV